MPPHLDDWNLFQIPRLDNGYSFHYLPLRILMIFTALFRLQLLPEVLWPHSQSSLLVPLAHYLASLIPYTMVYNYHSVAVMPSYRLLPIQWSLVEKKKLSLDSPYLAVCLERTSASRGHPFPILSNQLPETKTRKGRRRHGDAKTRWHDVRQRQKGLV